MTYNEKRAALKAANTQKARELLALGIYTRAEIAELIGVSPRTISEYLGHEGHKITYRARGKRKSAEYEKALKLHTHGKSISEISKSLNINRSTVYNWLKCEEGGKSKKIKPARETPKRNYEFEIANIPTPPKSNGRKCRICGGDCGHNWNHCPKCVGLRSRLHREDNGDIAQLIHQMCEDIGV